MHIPLLASAVLLLFFTGLSLNVSFTRIRKRKHGDVSDAQLTKAIRAQGNASEYIPLMLIAMLYLESASPSLYLDALALLAVVSRVLHAAGMLTIATVNDRHPLRYFGALGTYVCLVGLGGLLLTHGIS